ncbi:MAG: DUF5615 family PIN-like protein [Acidobacteriota bacterium]|nr:DUF5615 family PIN-like protein [Acidobacteriota bacterium]
MRFFVDNNLSPKLAHGMAAFGEDVTHLQDHYPADAKDTDWLPRIGRDEWILLTRDDRVRFKPAELGAIKQHRVGAFYLGGKERSRWELIQQVVRNWPRMNELAEKTARPFAFRVPPQGAAIDRLTL